MKKIKPLTQALLLCLAPFGSALAQDATAQTPTPTTVDAAQRKAVVQSIATQLQANYVFPEIAQRLSVQLKAREASGAYASATHAEAFSNLLSKDLRELGKDGHFAVGFDPQFKSNPPASIPGAEQQQQMRTFMSSMGFGFERVERLPGNVGYLELRGFGPAEIVAEAMSAAVTLLSGTDAMIIDLRRNGGGEPSGVAQLLSHFFPSGDQRHLNDIYTRPLDTTQQYWTNPTVATRYAKPVYVLTSKRTFSGGEECAYDFQTQKRGTIVGESTGGGSNPGDNFALAKGFVMFIPTGKSINPVTKTNWEHVGVKPDIAVPAAQAQQTAYVTILRTLVAASKDPDQTAELQEALAMAEKGESPKPNYAPPR